MEQAENLIEIELEREEESDFFDNAEPEMVEPFDPIKIQINQKSDVLLNIITRLKNDEIDMHTDFQRHADLWTPVKMSRLIESILIRFPLPAFFFDASSDDKWLIVDGLQRLSAIRKFVVEDKLHLTGLEYLKDLSGKKYTELPRQYQRRIDECSITLFLIMPGTPANVKYSVFKRINTGGLVLNGQEIRNALSSPRERDFLQKLAEEKALFNTLGDMSKRMIDQELILRFIAFYTSDYQKGVKNIAEFLDNAMEYLKIADSKELTRISAAFRRAITLCEKIFGDRAFEKSTGDENEKKKRKNSSLFEAWTVSLARVSDDVAQKLVEKNKLLVSRFSQLIKDDEIFFRSISMATQKRENIQIRHQRIKDIINEVANA
ncbi:MAG: DUF262 domain-containing protein [Spirochaetaceae bacterium]|jgi:hypothetical protein|nr:DUF262 domain-containing protein [Spirochaetaceae bacterium]